MYTLVTFATQWGSKYGGVNSFNEDFLTAFGFAYHQGAKVVCIVRSDTPEEREAASKANVRLVSLPYTPQDQLLGAAHARAGIDELRRLNINFDPDKTVWLGHDRITGEAAIEAAEVAGGLSAVIHHMSYDHYESYAEGSRSAHGKTHAQSTLFQKADIALAVGPLLRDALRDRLSGSKAVHMLIPGLAEIDPREPPTTFVAFLSGRLSDDAARIKQGHLGVAAFAKAQLEARQNNMPDALCRQPKLILRGVDFEGEVARSRAQQDPETELKKFAEEYAHGVVNLHALPYTYDRQRLYSELSGASVALMPSWHEGFGLVAWEAIAAGVPLIVGQNSGVYRLLKEQYPGTEKGFVYSLDIGGSGSAPFFREEDLTATVVALKEIANNPAQARKQASILRNMLAENTWAACAEQAANAFCWNLQKGSMPADIQAGISQGAADAAPAPVSPDADRKPLRIPAKQWRAGVGMADSQLLRAEEGLLPFDPARQPDVNILNVWLDDTQWPQAVRLITGPGGQGKTRLALELCRQRLASGWHAGFLDNDLDAKHMTASWQDLRRLNKPILIIIDYAETRQPALLALLRASLEDAGNQPMRMLLLARDGGEWWDNLPSKDRECEALLSGYATTGPFRLPALYESEQDRGEAYTRALHGFSQTLGVSAPSLVPELAGEHFERPLYVQMAALLALYGERPTTAQGLTKALLNHERRYWRGLLAHFNWSEPEHSAEQLLTLATLAGGFATPRDAQTYWKNASTTVLSSADFNSLFRELATLYPGKQGLQALRPDLLGESLVAQALLHPEAESILDAVLANTATQVIRRNALTILARLSTHRLDLRETLVDALSRHFRHCCQDIVAVSSETTSRLPELTELAFARLSPVNKSQTVGVLAPLLNEESVQLDALSCIVFEYLAEKSREKLEKKSSNLDRIADYAGALNHYAIHLARIGSYQRASDVGLKGLELSRRLIVKDPNRFEPGYVGSLTNYASYLNAAGKYEEALEHAREAFQIHKRLAHKNPDRFEPDYAVSLSNYARSLNQTGQNEEALKRDREALEIDKRLAHKNPDRFEPAYVLSLNNYAISLSETGQNEEALKHAREALEICKRLALTNPDRFDPDYAMSLSNYASHLSDEGKYEEALVLARQALEIRKRLAEKNPDRFEPDYATSMNNFASHLRETGKSEEALLLARQAFEIRKRLAEKNPDRFEPEYAMSLSNYASHLSDEGKYEEALVLARQALEIRERLVQKNSRPFADALFNNTCLAHFLTWLCNQDKDRDQPDIKEMMTLIPAHRRPLMLLYSAFVEACWATYRAARVDAFRRLCSAWGDLSMPDRIRGEPYCLCAAAWCATFEPAALVELDWQDRWRRYAAQRQGRLPHWMLEVARRLDFQWPDK